MSTKTDTMKLVKPDATDEVVQTLKDIAANFDRIDRIFPVGSIYMSTKNVNPGTFIGGTWSRIEGRFLLGCSSSHPAAETGGEEKHTLSASEMPSHSHKIWTAASSGEGNYWSFTTQKTTGAWYDKDTEGSHVESVGGSQPHNNMPPYLAVYMWERTA